MSALDQKLARQYAALAPGELVAWYTLTATRSAWKHAGVFTPELIGLYAAIACIEFGRSIPLPREPRW